jgi:hypothetical protein
MSTDDLGAMFGTFKRSAFRLETLPEYSVDEEQAEFARYLAGEPLPNVPEMEDWLDLVRRAVAQGKVFERVRVLPDPLTPYARFEIDWGYLYNATAGERIAVAPASAWAKTSTKSGDFWLFDDEIVFAMEYDDAGAWLGTKRKPISELPTYQLIRDNARRYSIPLAAYLATIRRGE